MKLYSFFRSGTSHRLRIALKLKGLSYDYEAVDLRREQHLDAAYKALHPQGLVPALQTDGEDGLLIQSPAIIEWLEERYPELALLPADPACPAPGFARWRPSSAATSTRLTTGASSKRCATTLVADEAAIHRWCATWIVAGFDAIETMLAADPQRGDFCFGDTPTLADVYLVPRVESARRFKIDLGRWPLIGAVDAACAGLAGLP
jgi:maleylpyruvate isomerase